MGTFKSFVRGIPDFLRQQDTGGVPVNPPLTQTAMSHAITLRTMKGLKIARIQSWSPTQTRRIDSEYEIDANGLGEPIDKIPQIISTNTISVNRYELYTSHIGEAFGVPRIGTVSDLVSLANQVKPFHVREIWRDPFGSIRAYIYTDAWFSNWGLTIGATGDRLIQTRATLEFKRRLKLN